MKSGILLPVLCFLAATAGASEVIEAKFTGDGWKQSDWSMVKSWRWPHQGKWIQGKDFIANTVPGDATPQELESKRVGETFTSMLLDRTFKGNATISCTMDFDFRMAPGLIIAAEPVKTELGLEYREHFEIILFNKGINVWHHYFEDGKQKWMKKAFLTTDLKANTPYELIVQMQFTARGPQMTLQAGGQVFGFYDHAIPREYRVGIVASEGVNRFYDFKVALP